MFGVERFAYESQFSCSKKHRLILRATTSDVFWSKFLQLAAGYTSEGSMTFAELFEVHEIQIGETWDGIPIRIFATKHMVGVPSFGLVIGEQVIYSGDTIPLDAISDEKAVTHIFHDFTTQHICPVHITADSLTAAYTKHVLERIWLIGYEDRVTREDIPGTVAGLAWPGQTVELSPVGT